MKRMTQTRLIISLLLFCLSLGACGGAEETITRVPPDGVSPGGGRSPYRVDRANPQAGATDSPDLSSDESSSADETPPADQETDAEPEASGGNPPPQDPQTLPFFFWPPRICWPDCVLPPLPPPPKIPEDKGPVYEETAPPADGDIFADAVVDFSPGPGGGWNAEDLPEVALGPPQASATTGGENLEDTLSLGRGGHVTLEMTDFWIVDGDGPDFIVFENPLVSVFGLWTEPAIVEVSADGETFHAFPCEVTPEIFADGLPSYEDTPGLPRCWYGVKSEGACAGVHAVGEAPWDDSFTAGGDPFDISDVGLEYARFVRIRDAGVPHCPVAAKKVGFDLDAVAIIHGTTP